MTEHFNGLSPPQAERLAMLAEECAEVVQAVTKILRHGYESRYPNGGETNRGALQRELGNVMAIETMMTAAGDISASAIALAAHAKADSVLPWTHHQSEFQNND